MTALGFGLALLIGLALGLLGGGGSILTIPVLHHIMGYSVRQAVPMSLVVVGITSAVGAAAHWRERNVQFRTAVGFGIPAIVGAVLGADLGPRVDDDIRLTVFAVVMLAAAMVMLRGLTVRPLDRPTIPFVTLIGGFMGLLTGFVGVGGGFLYVPVLTGLAGLPIKQAVGTSLVLILLSCAAGMARYLGNPALGGLDWAPIGLFTGIALVGAALGSRLVRYVSQSHLRRGFAVFLLVLGTVVLFVRR